IVVPPLRDRREDIPLLVRYFVDRHSRRMGKRITSIPPEAMQILQSWNWPGNIRELDNFIERAVILSSGPVLRVSLNEFENPLQVPSLSVPLSDPRLESAERDHILRILRETRGIIGGSRGAAERLGLKRTTLNSKLKKLGIARQDYI
ncbi:MAG: Fis family transcriptional regulator, partial [Acidobacteriia bacterium]|nr:Fis family transcriptional regulator [Terriglobia bacterium]